MTTTQLSATAHAFSFVIPAASSSVPVRLAMLVMVLLSVVLTGCSGVGTANATPTRPPSPAPYPAIMPTPTPTPASRPRPAPVIKTRLTAREREAVFDNVWQAVNDNYFDPTFGGKDWKAIGDGYRQRLATVQDDATFWLDVVNPMLFELGVSHIAALPPELSSQMDPMTFSAGALGMDVRLLDGQAVITEVAPGFPADKAGLRPGFVITTMKTIDGWTLEELAAIGLQTPPNNERNRRATVAQRMRSLLYGELGSSIDVDYLNGSGQPQRATLPYVRRSASTCAQFDPSLPPACTDFEARRLASGIGYIRFSAFLPTALDSVLQAMDDMHDAPALIIDLRGNPGGVYPVRKAIASKLVGEPKLFMRYQHRDGLEVAYLDSVPKAYQGEVVILVDELSASSSEEFAGSLQALGRATVVGSQTPGRCLVANIVPLADGAILTYPYGQSQTPDGRVLEDNGVVPDVEVALDRALLLQGVDTQLEAAVRSVTGKAGK